MKKKQKAWMGNLIQLRHPGYKAFSRVINQVTNIPVVRH